MKSCVGFRVVYLRHFGRFRSKPAVQGDETCCYAPAVSQTVKIVVYFFFNNVQSRVFTFVVNTILSVHCTKVLHCGVSYKLALIGSLSLIRLSMPTVTLNKTHCCHQ